ncbi:type I polyketide synthase [Streptomyces sp. NPDC013455]|uniref:type I polyketide synthase n=1 Tax=Streptomyces sp. NPDC013455 TaxID=3155605 RepID=UPI0033F8602F
MLITGGTGSLAGMLARHLVRRHGVRHLVLVSRRGPEADGARELVAELEALGAASVAVPACDVTDRDAVAALLTGLTGPRLTAVVHAAGVFDAGVVGELDEERLARVFAPKVTAVRHLDELTRELVPDLDAFVTYSSVSGVFLGAGTGGYGAANACMDGLVARRRAAGFPAQSLAWGLWEQTTGMGAGLDDLSRSRMSRRGGVLALGPDEGMRLFDAALESGHTLLVPARLDLRGLRADAAGGATVPPLLRGLVRAGRRTARGTGREGREGLAGRLAGLPPAEREALLLDLVRTHVANVLGHSGPDRVRSETAFKDAGFDSLTSVELRNRLREATGLGLPATAVFDYPTPLALARHLDEEFQGVTPAAAAPTAVPHDPDEPVAVVGMACRLPGGVGSPEDLWRLVREARDGVTGFPTDRGWDLDTVLDAGPQDDGTASAGTSHAGQGGFLHEAPLFDPLFFGISPREAVAMDPQQRLLLETSWEALERAGIDPLSLKGTDVGVFSGIMGVDYYSGGEVPDEVGGFALTGAGASVASGRVSYVFGFEGPAVTVDTACSSSLVAMHLAAQALRAGECSLALAGGSTVMAGPGMFLEFSRQRALASDGRCKSYADAADGTGWAEGAGVVVLERLSEARRKGHPVLAVIRGSAVNQDGASNGLTAPNGPSQQRVIRKALAAAGLTPADVDLVEGHGTGTVLGDPIEAQALLATYGKDRDPGRPLWLGSLKSNIGHAQAAAGVAGVIKAVQALRHREMPATLHVDAPSSQVDWSAGAVELLTEAREWADPGRPRRAAVSSFGLSGTNAHLILEEAPEEAPEEAEQPPAPEPAGVVPLVVSARGTTALAGQAARLAAFLGDTGAAPADVAAALATRRAVLPERAVVVAGTREEALAGLGALARGESAPALVTGSPAASAGTGKIVFVFPGQGGQWTGMGRELLDTHPVFAERIAECARALEPWVDWKLEEVLRGEAPAALVDRADVVQPASFAMMVGLAAVWAAAGVVPDAVLGHSQGEIAAACVAGALPLPEAARLVALRAQVIAERLSGHGGMAAAALSEAAAAEAVEPWAGRVHVCAVNGPSSVVLSGDADALDEAVGTLTAAGVRARRIATDFASHTPRVETAREPLLKAFGDVRTQAPVIPFHSTVTGERVTGAGVLDADYWYRNVRCPVRFGPVAAGLLETGHTVFVEIGAHPVLAPAISETADGADVLVTGTLRRDDGGPRRLLTAMAELFVKGVPVDWTAALPATARPVDLPTYAFDHQHYWLPAPAAAGDAASLGLAGADHPLVGAVVEVPDTGGVLCTSRLSLRTHPWLADHAVGDVVLLPGTGLVELAVRAGDEAGCSTLDELVIEAPLILPAQGGVRVQVAVGGPDDTGSRTVTIHSARDGAAGPDGWTRHATGVLAPAPRTRATTHPDLTAWPPPGAERVEVTADDFYAGLRDHDYRYGPVFRGLRAVWRRGDELFAEIALPEQQHEAAAGFGIHPALLDAALHTKAFLSSGEHRTMLPFAWNGLTLHASGAASLRVRVTRPAPDALSLEAADETGSPVLGADSLVFRPVAPEQLRAGSGGDMLFGVDWVPLPRPEATEAPSWLRVSTAEEVATLAEDAPGGAELPHAVVLDATTTGPDDTPLAVTERTLEVVQTWLAGGGLDDTRLVVLTRGAVPAGGDRTATDPGGAAVWGLIRAAQAENPDQIVLLDTDPGTDPGTGAAPDPGEGPGTDPGTEPADPGALLGAVLATGEPQVAVRGGALYVPRLTRAASAAPARPVLDPEGTVLITGGTGSLAGMLARHLVRRHGVRHLVLVSRRGPEADGARELVAELEALGAASVAVPACDVTDRDAVAALLTGLTGPRLTAVVHAAGLFDAGVVGEIEPERLARVFAPKVTAVRHLDELTRELAPDLDAFVTYSSVSAHFLGAGTGGYGAANACMDGLVARRRAAGFPAQSLAWGLWEQTTGMAARTDELTRGRLSRRGGLLALDPEEGMALFDAALGSDRTLLVPAKLDLRGLRADAADGTAVPPLLRGLVRAGRQAARAAVTGDERRRLAERLAQLPAGERTEALLELVRTQVAVVLGYTAGHRIDADQGLFDIGFDSLTALELRNRLSELTGTKLTAGLVFDHPTPVLIVAHLTERMYGEDAPGPVALSV